MRIGLRVWVGAVFRAETEHHLRLTLGPGKFSSSELGLSREMGAEGTPSPLSASAPQSYVPFLCMAFCHNASAWLPAHGIGAADPGQDPLKQWDNIEILSPAG